MLQMMSTQLVIGHHTNHRNDSVGRGLVGHFVWHTV